MQNENYRIRWGISQSMWKKWRDISPQQWKRLYIDRDVDVVKDTPGFTLGDITDTLLFSPEKLEERFYVGEEGNLPSEAIIWIITQYYNHIIKFNNEQVELNKLLPENVPLKALDLNDTDWLLQYADAYVSKDKDGNEKIGWNTNWSSTARIKNILEKGSTYFEALKKADGRKIVSQKINFDAINLKNILHTNELTKDYFIPNKDNDLIFQLEIFTTYLLENGKEIPVKGALDIVRFNHINKTVQIIDFKSSYSAFNFLKSIKEYGYCDQLSFYDFLLRQWLVEYCQGQYCSYEIIPPINIVIDINDKIPYIYEYDWKDIVLSADGNEKFLFELYQTKDHGQRIKKGWKSIIDDIGWHYCNNDWSIPRELKENKKIKVNLI